MKPESMCKRLFLKELRDMADDLYSHGDSHEPSEIWKQKSSLLDGFVKAGMLMDVVKMKDVQDIIDASHLERFGEKREERSLRLKTAEGMKIDNEIDWNKYESPAFTRVNVDD